MVEVRIGGDFYFEPLGSDQNLLLIAGGIGINPIWSIMQETIESDRNSGRNRLIQLLYSAKTEEELIFLVIRAKNFPQTIL